MEFSPFLSKRFPVTGLERKITIAITRKKKDDSCIRLSDLA